MSEYCPDTESLLSKCHEYCVNSKRLSWGKSSISDGRLLLAFTASSKEKEVIVSLMHLQNKF